MIIITGGEGFIGSALIKKLNSLGYDHIISLDTVSYTKREIHEFVINNADDIDFIFHLGAISDTTIDDVKVYDENNERFTYGLFMTCDIFSIPILIASSAATYGDGSLGFDDNISSKTLLPLNYYGKSKNSIDSWIKNRKCDNYWVIVKFFNVYGYDESHKNRMASMVYHVYNQIKDRGYVELFKSDRPEYSDGDQKRDFVYVEDVVDICIKIMKKKPKCDIYNVGTGKARTFNELALFVFKALELEPDIRYIDMPDDLKSKYQYFTEAKIDKLRYVGCEVEFKDLEVGVFEYVNIMQNDKNR